MSAYTVMDGSGANPSKERTVERLAYCSLIPPPELINKAQPVSLAADRTVNAVTTVGTEKANE